MPKLMNRVLLIGLFISSFTTFATVHLHPVTWEGKKWEYLVEFPSDIQHIDPVRMEEVLDTAGHHGWELVGITSEFHFYAFYFKRHLQDHRLAAHRQRLVAAKATRHRKDAELQKAIHAAHRAKLKKEGITPEFQH